MSGPTDPPPADPTSPVRLRPAVPGDEEALVALIRELAEYER